MWGFSVYILRLVRDIGDGKCGLYLIRILGYWSGNPTRHNVGT